MSENTPKFEIPTNLIPSDPRFGAGPSKVPVETLEKLAKTGKNLLGTSHRKPVVKNLVASIQDGLKSYFSVPNDTTIVIGNGGATLSWDMIGLGMVEKKSAHYTCGEFSTKWYKAHNDIPWIEAQNISKDYGQGHIVEHQTDCDVTCFTLNETSTGVQNTQQPERVSGKLVAVDATSGAGQIPLDYSKTDFFYFSPQKAFAGEGGTFFGLLSAQARERVLKINETDRYIPHIFNWKTVIDNADKNQTYNTPSLSDLFIMNEHLQDMLKVGHDNVVAQAEEKAKILYSWAESKPYLSCYVQDPSFRSRSVATIDVDDKIPVKELNQQLRDQGVVLDIDSYRKLGKNQFRIAFFHFITKEDVEKLTQLLSHVIENYYL